MPRRAPSNVDGQFEKAGFGAGQIHECHGTIHRLQCLVPCGDATWPADEVVPDIDEALCRWRGPMPRCPHCGGLARPNVLMFRDSEWLEARAEAQAHEMERWLSKLRRPVVVEVGAGTAIPSVRHFSEEVICNHGGRLVRINQRESRVPTPWEVGLAIAALEGLQAIDRAVEFSQPKRVQTPSNIGPMRVMPVSTQCKP